MLLERCLKKEPKNRYSSISDARVDIQEVLADPGGVFAQPAAAVEPRAKRRQMLLWASVTVILIIIAGIAVWQLKPTEPKRVIYSEYVLPEDQQFFQPLQMGAQLAVSPDGKWMAYTSYESGQSQIYVRTFPNVKEGRWQISTSGGHSPLWSPHGNELFYRNGDETMAVSVDTDPTFSPGNPEVLFRGKYYSMVGNAGQTQTAETPWDIHPDGKRFLMMKPAAAAEEESSEASAVKEPRKIIIVQNWFEELKEKVPVD